MKAGMGVGTTLNVTSGEKVLNEMLAGMFPSYHLTLGRISLSDESAGVFYICNPTFRLGFVDT
jgi:hypothetical protein